MVVEWISRLTEEFEFHIYSQRVEDIDLSTVVWHRIPKLPGPHLGNFLWWFAANHLWRAWDHRFRAVNYDVVFSPGVNCLDAEAVSVHIVFAEFVRRMGAQLKLARNSARSWPRLLHRKLYYKTIIFLERRVFMNPRAQLILTSPRTPAELERFYSRRERFPMICAGIDHGTFNPSHRMALREEARSSLNLRENQFTLLLIGNDWRKKGLLVLLDALAKLRDLPLQLIVVSHESAAVHQASFRHQTDSRVRFLPPRHDVEFFYAAADAYTGPSLEDTFALPASEAMACGLPVVMSSRAGVSEFITHGIDGLILDDPTDAVLLASIIRRLFEDREFRERLGAKAAETARQFTWEQNARELAAIFEEITRRKSRIPAHTSKPER